jgi:hypothetical protein
MTPEDIKAMAADDFARLGQVAKAIDVIERLQANGRLTLVAQQDTTPPNFI